MSEIEDVQAVEKTKPGNAYQRQADLLAQSGKMWKPGIGIIDIPQDGGSTSSELNSRGNRNERIQSSIKEGFDAATAGSVSGNAPIKQAQASDNSHTGGNGSGSSGHKHPDAASISAVARAQDASGIKAAVQVSFNLDPDERELKIAQNRLMASIDRVDAWIDNDTAKGLSKEEKAALKQSIKDKFIENIPGMSLEDINTSIKALATRTRPPEASKAVGNFFDRTIPTQDYFDPIAVGQPPQ